MIRTSSKKLGDKLGDINKATVESSVAPVGPDLFNAKTKKKDRIDLNSIDN